MYLCMYVYATVYSIISSEIYIIVQADARSIKEKPVFTSICMYMYHEHKNDIFIYIYSPSMHACIMIIFLQAHARSINEIYTWLS